MLGEWDKKNIENLGSRLICDMNKEEYLKEVKKRCLNRQVVIYGAGRKAIGLLHFLKEENIKAEAFIVTQGSENKYAEEGLSVYSISDNPFLPDRTVVLIGVRKRWLPDIIRTLEAHGYNDYIEPLEGIEYLLDGDKDRSELPVLQVTLQIGCKISCMYCPQDVFVSNYSKDKKREKKMTLEKFKMFIDKTKSDVIIDFAGFTEPFLNSECVEMIKYADYTGHPIELFTTLAGLDDRQFNEIKRIAFREVVLHIPDSNNNSRILITDEYIKILSEVMQTQKPDGSPFIDWGSCHGNVHEKVKGIIDGKMRVITQLHDRAGNLKEKGEIEICPYLTGKISCSGAPDYNHNVLLPDGTVLLCDSDWGMKHILGNLNDSTYVEILSGKEIRRIRAMLEEKNSDVLCRSCCYAVRKKEVDLVRGL